jgi:hypothetical protein
MGVLQTEHEFTLPLGYPDEAGTLHKKGTMRLATAADEVLPLKDPRVQQNPAYLSIILLSRVITRLGDMPSINPKVVEGLFAADLNYLQEMYNRINFNGNNRIKAICPKCENHFEMEIETSGG